MKKTTYTCEICKLKIDGHTVPERSSGMVGGGELCTLHYESTVGLNKIPQSELHYHYACLCRVIDLIL